MPQFLFNTDDARPVRSLAKTEDDEAFYQRRIQEEQAKANHAGNRRLKQLHLRWALLYQQRIDGASTPVAPTAQERVLDARHQLEPFAALAEPGRQLDEA